MATLPKYDEWMEHTNAGILHTRSSELKAFDESLKRHEQGGADLGALLATFNTWIERQKREHQGNWRASARNKPPQLMVSRVYKALNPTVLDAATMQALQDQAGLRRALLQQSFRNARFDLKGFEGTATVAGAARDLRSIAGNYKAAKAALSQPVGSASAEMVKSMFGTGLQGIRDQMIRSTVGEALVHFVPVMSQFAGAAKVILAWGTTAYAKYKEVTNFGQRAGLSTQEDVSAAFDAITMLLQRETTRQRTNALITTGQFLADAALAPLGGAAFSGPATAVVGTAAKLAYKLHLLGVQYQETCEGQRCLGNTTLGSSIFRVCPLAGAYYIVGIEDFALLNMLTVDFGSEDWSEDVLLLKPGLELVRRNALSLIDASVFKIVGMPSPHVLRTSLGQMCFRVGQVMR